MKRDNLDLNAKISVKDVIDLLAEYGPVVRSSYEKIESEASSNIGCGCCYCRDCCYHHDDCVCLHNEAIDDIIKLQNKS